MTAKCATIAFHIGAHKTATSHLQRCLTKASEHLADQGVRYYGPQYFRQRCHAIRGLFGLQPSANPKVTRRSPADQLAIMRKDGQRLVFSEENFIGPLNDPKGESMTRRYPEAGARLAPLAQALDQDLDVFVCARRPTAYLNSAYCQMLLSGLIHPFDIYKANNLPGSIDWAGLIAQSRAAKGVGRVVVWCYNDYKALFPNILAELVGPAHASLVPWVTRSVNPGLSRAAVAQVLAHSADTDKAQIGYQARCALPVEEGRPAFDGYSAAEHAAGDAVYASQIAAIGAMDGVTLLQPAAR